MGTAGRRQEGGVPGWGRVDGENRWVVDGGGRQKEMGGRARF